MNRLVSLLLVGLFMLGQPLPHSHAGTDVDHSDGHAARPHVHVAPHGHSHSYFPHSHGHSHVEREAAVDRDLADVGVTDAADEVGTIFGLKGHDEDAFYLADLTRLHLRASGGVRGTQPNFAVVQFNLPAPFDGRPVSGPRFPVSSRLSHSMVPIYRLTASLRL